MITKAEAIQQVDEIVSTFKTEAAAANERFNTAVDQLQEKLKSLPNDDHSDVARYMLFKIQLALKEA